MRLLQLSDADEISSPHDYAGNTPKYAILSHTWSEAGEELVFRDLHTGRGKSGPGYAKVVDFGRQARRDGLKHFWIDTCCVDRASSAEISEALNSMFRWYQRAAKCYVYLSDVRTDSWESHISQSKWFTRGWTLLELLAPESVEFFSCTWERVGDKGSLQRRLVEITGIPVPALQGEPLSSFSTAERMSWAAHRTTSHEEDLAYCLLGIFDVFMPIIYGEGQAHAMKRLQDEIRWKVSTQAESNASGMRLLVAGSDPLRMEAVPVDDRLQYAILSHTWGNDEVSFDDMRIATAEQRRGYAKLKKCCDLAAAQGLQYVWVDTCCIDKTSSSELQEAICSMYSWYKNAAVCYVYLEDFVGSNLDYLAKCKWFTRGWTLQELIAPDFVEFYNEDWDEVGTKRSLCNRISKITSIDPLVLRGADPTERTVAERMSWAASRSTTRIEDTAYSLMGLFSVFMPMLYGEGHRAFMRLQEEIIKQTEDDTMFAWVARFADVPHRGIFAHSPAEFSAIRSGLGSVLANPLCPHLKSDRHSPPNMTSRGLILALPLLQCTERKDTYLAWISNVGVGAHGLGQDQTILCIRLRQIQSSPQVFARVAADQMEHRPMADSHLFEEQTVCVLPSTINKFGHRNRRKVGEIVILPFAAPMSDDIAPQKIGIADGTRWEPIGNAMTFSGQQGAIAWAAFHFPALGGFNVVVGSDEGVPWCEMLKNDAARSLFQSLEGRDRLKELSKSDGSRTDRAKMTLPDGKIISASIGVARSSYLYARRFALSLELSSP